MGDDGRSGPGYPRFMFKTEVIDADPALVQGIDATSEFRRSRTVRTAPVAALLRPCATCDSTNISVRAYSTGLDPALDAP